MTQTSTTPQSPQRRLHAAPDPLTDDRLTPGKQALITALRAHGPATSSVLADQAHVGHSTARRLLGELVEQGVVTRTPGCGHGPGRTPHRFSLAGSVADDSAPAGDPRPLAVVPDPAHGATTAAQARTATPAAAQAEAERCDADADPADGGDGPASAAAEPKQGPAPTASVGTAGLPPRLGRNQLRSKVEQYLLQRSDQEFGPHTLSRVLGHSSGAITNVLVKLVQSGRARQTQDHPRRFAAHTATPDNDPA